MQRIRSLFWNPDQQRLRALWRLVLTFLLLAILVGTSQVALLGFFSNWTGDSLVLIAVLSLTLTLAILLAIFLAGLSFDRRRFKRFGFHLNRRWWDNLAFGFVLGALLMSLVFLIEWAAGWVSITGFLSPDPVIFWQEIGVALLLYACVALQEELVARGYLLLNLAEGLNLRSVGPRRAVWIAYLVSSVLFASLHMANENATLTSTLLLIGPGLLLGLGFILTGELAIPIGLHFGWNFFQGNGYGFPVSGNFAGPSIIAIRQSGPDWITGGAFGPEAGAISLLAVALGMLLIYLWVRRQNGARLQVELAEYPTNPDSQPSKG